MQLNIRREGAKTREDFLKCKYVFLHQHQLLLTVHLYFLRWAEGLTAGFGQKINFCLSAFSLFDPFDQQAVCFHLLCSHLLLQILWHCQLHKGYILQMTECGLFGFLSCHNSVIALMNENLLLTPSRKMYAQLNRLVSAPFNKLLYQALFKTFL